MSEGHDRNEAPKMEAAGSRIKTDVARDRLVKKRDDLVPVAHLLYKPPFFKDVKGVPYDGVPNSVLLPVGLKDGKVA
jgi:hypothetical protein